MTNQPNHQHLIFAFVAASGSGKTTMVERAVDRLHGKLQIVRSVTTRERRGPEDDEHYDFLDRGDFRTLHDAGELLYEKEYAGNLYGITRKSMEHVLSTSHGILALVEDSVRLLRAQGYDVRVIKVVKKGGPQFPDPLRNAVDAQRELDPLVADVVIINAFDEVGGLDRATDEMVSYIRGAIGG